MGALIMLTMDDLKELILNVPRMLAAGWAVWLAVGLALSVWARREKLMIDEPWNWGSSEHKSGVPAAKPGSGARASRPPKTVPASAGDAFGDLEKLLEPEVGSHRTPGEKQSPVLADIDRFIEGNGTVTGSNGAALAAPQSLP